MAADKKSWDFNLGSKPKARKHNFDLCRLNSGKFTFIKAIIFYKHLTLFELNERETLHMKLASPYLS